MSIAPAGILATSMFVLGTVLVVDSSPSAAKPDYSRRTKKECGYCHPATGWELNEAGKYYRDHRYSLDGYKPPEQPKPKAAVASTSFK